MKSEPDGGILVLTATIENEENPRDGSYRILRPFEAGPKELATIHLDFKDDLLPHEPGKQSYPFAVTEDAAWFFHQRKGLVKSDLSTGTMDYLPWNEFENILPVLKSYFDLPILEELERGVPPSFEWRLIDINEEDLLLFLGMHNGFFVLNGKTLKMLPDAALNRKFIKGKDAGGLMLNRVVPTEEYGGDMVKVYFAHDKMKNLFIASGYYEPWHLITYKDSLEALVIDPDGHWFDYSNVMRELYEVAETNFSWPGTYYSANFQYQLGSTVMMDGLLMVDLQPDLGIITIPRRRYFDYSGITSLDSSTLLVNTNRQVLRVSEWQDPSGARWDRMTQWWHFTARTGSSIVTHGDRIWMSALFYLGARTGLQWYDPATNETDYVPTDVQFEKFVFLNDKDVALFEDTWDVNEDGSLYIFNLESKTSRPFLFNNVPFSIGAKINDLHLVGDSLLWVGAQNGLWQIDFSNNEAYHFNQFEELRNQNILCIHKEDNGKLWLGSSNSGIFIFDPETGSIQQISETQGLSNNTVVGILADDQLNHWASTFNGINVLDSAGQVLFELKEKDGLLSSWFNGQSFYKLPNGKMVFGGTGGLSILEPDLILRTVAKRKPNHIYLTGLEYYDNRNNVNVVVQGSYDPSKPIRIPANQRYISLDFAISNYVDLSEHAYVYRLIPRGDPGNEASTVPWINLGSESQVTINNLPAGEFIVQVHGSDDHSNQLASPLEIYIHVHDFFYREWWFFLLCAFIVFIVAFIWIRRIISEKTRLELEVERRTLQIQTDKATIELQAEKLKELDQAKSRFFTNISHEFRTPLTVILGMADQIKGQVRIRQLIHRNAQVLLRLVNQILELRKLESAGLEAQFIRGDVIAFIRILTESFHSLADDNGVLLKFDSKHLELVLDYDSEKLHHIVSNLLTNAIKFTPDGGEVKIELETLTDVHTPVYQISVSDTGTGIPEEKIPRIFDRFYQVDDELSRTGSGTGIGLALVKELVKLLGGEINVVSKLDIGTTFKVQLPLTQSAELNEDSQYAGTGFIETEEEFSDQISAEKVKGIHLPTLLIVEDNRDVAEYLSACLEENYNLLFASDGREGIDMATEYVPDIIISDVMMPEVDGYSLCNTLKTEIKTSHIPIVLLTAKADVDSRITGLERGADAYLAKPFNEKELKVQLQNLLQLRIKLQQRYVNPENLRLSEDLTIQQEDRFVIRVREAILENMEHENFGVPELCKILFMSRTQLHNKLKSLTNKSTSHFIRLIRIEKACQLLRESDLNISQVSLEVGIESLPYFSRIFTEHTGLSPNKYREKYREEQ